MTVHILEIINALLRWFHVIAGIAWVGASFYFIWVENALNRQLDKQRHDDIAGHLWAIHGGGFYYLEKYKAAPSTPLPAPLHWFKWEAYSTWLSGMVLMSFIYYLNADIWLVKAGSPISSATAIVVSLVFLIAGYGLYALLCRTPLLSRPLWFIVVGLLCIAGLTHGLSIVFSARATFLHIGALIGTIMAANVLMVIIPTQKKMVAAAQAGEAADLAAANYARLRSLHNNYLSLPVIFLMLSNHYPIFINHDGAIITLLLMIVAAIFIRHFFNCHHRGEEATKWLVSGGVVILLMAVQLIAAMPVPRSVASSEKNMFEAAQMVIETHCTQCHATSPTNAAFASPPAGLVLENDEQILVARPRIHERAIVTQSMPPGNITGITEEERNTLAAWSGGE